MTLALVASRPHYLEHMAPVWWALDPAERGQVLVEASCVATAERLGLPAALLPHRGGRGRSNRVPAIVASGGDSAKARRLGYRPLVRMEHGIGQSYSGHHPAYAGGDGQDDVALFLVPNETCAARWRRYEAPVVVIGSPFAEALPGPDSDAGAVAISFHWHDGFPERRSALPHYIEGLRELVGDVPLLGHGHPRALERLTPIYASLGISLEPDYRTVLRRARLLIADNTSALYEAALTRPVVVLDAPWYRRDVEHGLRFWAAADVGIRVSGPDHLASAVHEALVDRPEVAARREAALRLVYAHRAGGASRAVEAIRSMMERWHEHDPDRRGVRGRRGHRALDGG